MVLSRSVIRLSVMASSVLLVGGFVSYRAGAFDWLKNSEPAPTQMGGSKIRQVTFPSDFQPQEKATPQTIIMSGSKSLAPIIVNPTPPGDQPSLPATPPPQQPAPNPSPNGGSD